MKPSSLDLEKTHLANLLEAIQRCVYFLDASSQKMDWPLSAQKLQLQQKDIELFEAMAAINERFAKLQDSLAAAMRHACLLSAEPADNFLKVLSFFEKNQVIDSVELWQLCRTARNLTAHGYETDYLEIAEHFNTLNRLTPPLYLTAQRFQDYCKNILGIETQHQDFAAEFSAITANINPIDH